MKAKICIFFIVTLLIGTLIPLNVIGDYNQKNIELIIENDDETKPQIEIDRSEVPDLGVEWVRDYIGTVNDLIWADDNGREVYNFLTKSKYGYTGRFKNKNGNADQCHWGEGSSDLYVDDVDLAFFCGHTDTTYWNDPQWSMGFRALLFREESTNNDYYTLTPGEAYQKWGDKDCEWVSMLSCQALHEDWRGYWAAAMNGLHLICGFSTNAKDCLYSYYWVRQMTDSGTAGDYAKEVYWSWLKALDYSCNPEGREAVVIAEDERFYNDYLHGQETGPESDPTEKEINTHYNFVTHEKGPILVHYDFPIRPLPDTMNIYKFKPKLINESYVTELGLKFGISGPVGHEEESYFASNGSKYIEISEIEGLDYADTDKLWKYHDEAPNLPTFEDAKTIAVDFINSLGLYPSDAASYVDVFYCDYMGIGEKASDTIIEKFPITISYCLNREIDTYKVIGPGSTFYVYIGENSEVQGLTKIWRDYEYYETIDIISYSEIQDLLDTYGSKVVIGGLPYYDNMEIGEVTVGYFEDGFGKHQEFLIPVYILFADFYSDGELDSSEAIFIPASLMFLSPIVDIKNPDDEYICPDGTNIEFKAGAIYGSPPYTFEWISDIDGFLGFGSELNISTLTPCIKDGKTISHAITCQVTDNKGNIGKDIVTVKITTDNNPPTNPDITGPVKGTTEELITFTIVSSDPDGDDISYYVNIIEDEDQGIQEMFGPFKSGKSMEIKYSWVNHGKQFIMVKAIDSNKAESNWGTHMITIPRFKTTLSSQFYWLLDLFPIFQRFFGIFI
ncbi:hypothetical protein AYK24_06865 [Thermoplasmatales archaeon SG8-52-4]|nr:MAG: hypothetical protein AYK24_06865 [Thermoplasmatales archaeon SG8-52-4]